MDDEAVGRAFYAALGADGLAARTTPAWDEQIVAAVAELLAPGDRVLDVGCGYGRVALPLARAGFDVAGVDHAAGLIDAARAAAAGASAAIDLVVGSMTSLPYPPASFDAVICLWSAFHELLDDARQVRAVAEMWRVLRPGGFALVEGPPFTVPSDAEIATGERRGAGHPDRGRVHRRGDRRAPRPRRGQPARRVRRRRRGAAGGLPRGLGGPRAALPALRQGAGAGCPLRKPLPLEASGAYTDSADRARTPPSTAISAPVT